MDWIYSCPHCHSVLNPDQSIILLAEHGERYCLVGLHPQPGNYEVYLPPEVEMPALICLDKVNTAQWLDVIATAHSVGLRTTATIMFGHLEAPLNQARHLLAVRDLQERTCGFTEFVPLPFVHMEAPLYRRGRARAGPTWREARLMHAVARLTLHPLVTNIQASWSKLGPEGAAVCLQSGANDLGGTLMNESISRAAGAAHGQELPPEAMDELITGIGREPVHRTTLYGEPPEHRVRQSYAAPALTALNLRPARDYKAAS